MIFTPRSLSSSSKTSEITPAQKFGFACISAIGVMVLAVLGTFAAGASAASTEPAVSVVSPRSGTTLNDKAEFKAQVSKRISHRTVRVEVWLGSRRVAIDDTSPYAGSFDTTKLRDGNYELKFKAVVRADRRARAVRSHLVSRKLRVKVVNTPRRSPRPAVVTPPAVPPVVTPPPSAEISAITSGNAGWTMNFNDDFNGTSLDMTKWLDERDDWMTGMWPYNNLEGAWYSKSNNAVGNGVLTQTIRKIPSNGAQYTTGSINSNKRFGFKYGYVEARIKVPACSGCWPAFWMLPSKAGWPPEIDIFEFFNSINDRHAYFASHWKGTTTDQEYVTQWSSNLDLTGDWHTYGMLWTPEGVQAYIDGVPGPKYTGKAVPHESMYLILTLQQWNAFSTPDGVNMQTDYVRVFQHPDML